MSGIHPPPLPFELSDGDRLSPIWLRLRDHFADELAVLRMRNDYSHDAVETAFLRGQIDVFKRLLALDEPGPIVTGDLDPPRSGASFWSNPLG